MLCRLVRPPSGLCVGQGWLARAEDQTVWFGVTRSWRPFPCIGRDWPHSVAAVGIEPTVDRFTASPVTLTLLLPWPTISPSAMGLGVNRGGRPVVSKYHASKFHVPGVRLAGFEPAIHGPHAVCSCHRATVAPLGLVYLGAILLCVSRLPVLAGNSHLWGCAVLLSAVLIVDKLPASTQIASLVTVLRSWL